MCVFHDVERRESQKQASKIRSSVGRGRCTSGEREDDDDAG